MTDLTRPVKRKVFTARGEPRVVTLAPEGIWLREPRRRVAYLLPYGVAYQHAIRLQQDAKARAKPKKNKRAVKRGLL